MTIRVMLADDNKVMQEGLKALLDDAPEIEVVGLASNGREDLERASELQPDVVVMDLNSRHAPRARSTIGEPNGESSFV